MGYDPARFDSAVDDELLCPVCRFVLEDPIQAPTCEHAFCRPCIEEWLRRQNSCPVDRQVITVQQLTPAPRILRNLLNRLVIACENRTHGCNVSTRLDALAQHLRDCQYNPNRPAVCGHGCGLTTTQEKLPNHHCLRDLRRLVESQGKRMDELTEKVMQQQLLLQSQDCEIRLLKEAIRNISGGMLNPLLPPMGDVQQWAVTLPEARVTRWGGIISTPDTVLQAVMKRSLLDGGCPPMLASELMERAHERRWPRGLQSVEIRQANRTHYDDYVCRRIPCKQAVVVLAFENRHMRSDLMAEPGLVLIFAHGVH